LFLFLYEVLLLCFTQRAFFFLFATQLICTLARCARSWGAVVIYFAAGRRRRGTVAAVDLAAVRTFCWRGFKKTGGGHVCSRRRERQ